MRILGIETSCDETALAVYDSAEGLLTHQLHSQINLHRPYGGVVPELASRDHVRKLIPLLKDTLHQAGCESSDIDAVAYTRGPGLIGALLVGACFARSLAWGWGVPSVGVHHLEAHLMAVMLEKTYPLGPFVALLVSGGHSMLIEVRAFGHYRLLGETLDDAVGEAFDKTARLLGLPNPGGPALAQLAEQGRPGVYDFPRPMVNRSGMDMSFSGLKTFTRRCWETSDQSQQTKADIARAFEEAIVETLSIKVKRALAATHLSQLVVAGGVGANKRLRAQLEKTLKDLRGEVTFPRPEFCTDNGAMVAYVGCQRLLLGQQDDLSIQVQARWPLMALT